MFDKVPAALDVDRFRALGMFNNGDREHFASEEMTARLLRHAILLGAIGCGCQDPKDSSAKSFGAELYNAAEEGRTHKVNFMFPKPAPDMAPVPRVFFVAAMTAIGCTDGYQIG
jgi:hypothetical protein